MSLAGAKRVERPSEHRLGVLFEISIVCHVLCSWFWWVAGVSPVLGVVLVVRLVFWFSGSGLSVCLVPRGSSARLCGGAGGGLRVVPGLGVDVVRPALRPVMGGGLGVLGPVVVSVSRGSGCARFFFRLVGWWGVGRVFSARRSLFLLVPVLVFVVLSGLGFWGVSGWVGVFSPASVVRPGPVPVLAWLRGLVLVVGCSGFVWRV